MDSSMEPSYGSGAAIPEGSDSGRQRESVMGSAADVQNPSQQNVDVGDGIETHGSNAELTAARSQEQEAAAILEAANGLEPEYEFQSVEGGEGVLQGQAGDEGTLDGLGSFRQEPVVDQGGDVRQPVADIQTGGLLNGVMRGGRNAQLLDVEVLVMGGLMFWKVWFSSYSSRVRMPQPGPGDRILAATRAMQAMSLQDYGFEEHAVGGKQPGVSPAEAWPPGRQSGVFLKTEGEGGARSVQRPSAFPKALTEGQEVRGGSSAGGVVINGCVREGIYNDKGEIVLVAEQPKFYALQDDSSEQIEARGVAMLTKALPGALYEQALSCRSMEISVPDSGLLLDAVDKCMKALLQANPSLQFRIHSVRMQLQLDTSPTLESVEEYTRNLLAEMELLVVSVPDGGNKRQRVAAVGQDSGDKGNGKGPKGGKNGDAGGQQGAGTGRGGKGDPVKLCSAWSTDAGCPNGKQCSLKHAPERPGGCWVCGGMHQKADCKAPGGGKAPKDPNAVGDTGEDGGTKGKKGKPKGGEAKPPKTNVGQNPKGQPKGQSSTTNVSEAAIREAAQILQSLRLAAVKSDLQSATEILSKVGENGNRGLIDGGATSCMRTALPDEYNLPKIPVKLACGSCDMFINEHGTLLRQISVSPIISMKALLKLGYRMDWNATRCRVFHPKFGDLEVDTSSGCPEVDEGVALDLIREYELYVGRQDQRVARLQSMIDDLRDRGTGELLELIKKGDSQADAAFSVYVSRLYPEASAGVLDQCIVSLQESLEENHTWNRRRAFENIAHRWDFAHLSVDVAEDILCDSTYKFLLQQARDGRLRAVVGGPPCRTFSIARHLHETTGQGPRPIRLLGDSIGACGIKDLTCQEKAQRNTDDVMLLTFLTLISFAVESNRAIGVPDPACLVENPCVEDELRKDCVEDAGYVSLWSTPEWKDLEKRTVQWCEWAPGFIQAVNSMLNQAFYQMRSIMMGSKAKYLVVGVLSVPVLAVEGLKVDEPADADPVAVPLEGGVIDDAEWLMDDLSKMEEKDDDMTAKELSDARASWNEWEKLVKSSRDDWIRDAQSEVSFTTLGAAVDLDVAEPMHPADKLAQVLYKADRFQPKDLAELAVEVYGFRIAVYANRNQRQFPDKYPKADRQLLWETGFTLLPATRDEYWSYGSGYCVQQFGAGSPVRSMHMWRQGRGKASGQMWTGSSSFKLRDPNCPDAVGEGVGHLEKDKNSEKSQEFLDMVILEGQGLKVGDSRDLLAEKGIEICTSRCRCWSLELRKLQKRLEDVDEGRGSLVCGLEPCESIAQDDSEQFELYGVDWPMHADVSRAIDCLARQHHELRVLLQGLEEGEEATTSRCDQLSWDALKGLERHGNELREVEDSLLKTACPAVLRSLSVAEEVNPEEFEDPAQKGPSEPALTDESDPPPLQTKIIGADQVRREPGKWIPSMTEEYQSLVSRTGAVQELSDGQYKQLLEGGSGERNELYASGAGAESLRLMIRRCALQPEWVLGSVDVRTAFLQAPLLEQQRDGRRLVTIVRVPSILRETGVTTCRFWKVQKALYGLASAPRSWSNYRDKVLAGLRIPCEGGELRLSKMLEDANLLHIVRFPSESGSEDSNEGQRVGVIALYVDDVLIGAARPICEAVIKALQDQWELSPPEWLATTGDQMKFAGYELQKTSEVSGYIKKATS
ncbi:GIP, partial [Symbiodinium necroappetens]